LEGGWGSVKIAPLTHVKVERPWDVAIFVALLNERGVLAPTAVNDIDRTDFVF
jgi:hypothetical protein